MSYRISVPLRLLRSVYWKNAMLQKSYQRWNHNTVVNTTKLQVTERNSQIVGDLLHYYPSMSSLSVDDSFEETTISRFNLQFGDGKLPGDGNKDLHLKINGRIKNIRLAGKKMCFIDLSNNETQEQMQVIVNFNQLESGIHDTVFINRIGFLRKNDYIQVKGYPGYSENKNRTLSLKCLQIPILLAPVQLPLPSNLVNNSKINKNRVLDYQINGTDTLVLRFQIIKLIRQFLNEREFLEVETPMLSDKANGANAEPFITKANQLSADESASQMELRIAPELWLKRLIISGLNRVFEIGKVFRNEGIDATHNPEFTMLEFYQTYLSMENLISISEDLFKYILISLDQNAITEKFKTIKELKNILQENNWKFKRIEFLPTLQKELNIDLSNIDLSDIQSLLSIIPEQVKPILFSASELAHPDTHLSPQRILDKLCGHYIETKYCQSLYPTVIYHHPVVMSPLAKMNTENPLTTKRFEIFINGKEYINAYEEENCPQEQLQKFQAQCDFKANDKESLSIDKEYVEVMKSGMPPTGGLGLGIDRLCMLLLCKTRIEQVLPFGSLDDVNRQ